MNKRRLLKLADLLEADAKNKKGIKFDLGTWGRTTVDGSLAQNCGTTACAVGLAVISGVFKRSGLENHYGENSYRICPAYKGHSDWYATEKFFGIDSASAQFLFSDDNYPPRLSIGAVGERYVAKRIRDFVAGKVAPRREAA